MKRQAFDFDAAAESAWESACEIIRAEGGDVEKIVRQAAENIERYRQSPPPPVDEAWLLAHAEWL